MSGIGRAFTSRQVTSTAITAALGADAATSVPTLADLKALTKRPEVVIVETGQAKGEWQWEVGSTTTADDALVVNPTSGTAGRYKRIFDGAIYAEWFDFSTANSGTANSTALNAALTAAETAASRLVVIGTVGTFDVTATISLPHTVSLKGSGINSTILRQTTASTALITLGEDWAYCQISDLTLDRSVTATSGGHGITAPSTTGLCAFRRLEIRNQWVGLNLGPTENGDIENVLVENCFDDGVKMTNSATAGQMQWRLADVLCQKNNGYGFHVVSVDNGPSQITMGTWTDCYTFANKLGGAAFIADPAVPIEGVRAEGWFMGADGGSIVYMETYGTNHQFDGCFFELAGTEACGRNLGTAATNVGNGMEIRATEQLVVLNDVIVNGASYSGIKSLADNLIATSCTATNNGLASVGGERSGFAINGGAASLVNCSAFNTSGGTSQLFGMATAVDAIQLAACNFVGNASAAVFLGVTMTTASSSVGCLPATVNESFPLSAKSFRSPDATGGIGYSTGAGSTVTQGSGSGKATGFTLSTVCGRITTDNANLNAGASVSATWTNTAIAATDFVDIKHESGGTLGAYDIRVIEGAGSATLTITNTTAGNLAESLVLKFVLLKAVAA